MSSVIPRFAPLLAFLPALTLACARTSETPVQSNESVTSLGLAAQASELAVEGDLALVAAREFQAGGRDLDGDGDAFDRVAFLVDLATGTARNTGLALDATGPRRVRRIRHPSA